MYKFRGQEGELEDPAREKEDDYFPNVAKVGSRTLSGQLPAARGDSTASRDGWLSGQPIKAGHKATISAAPGDASASRFGDLTRLRATLEKLAGNGVPLPASTSSNFSDLLGADLSSVRIHATGEASAVTAAMGARALTHGSHIAFAPGAYDAATADHDHVLAHELVHVVQNQRSGGAAMQLAARLDVGPSGSAIESEAEAGAHALTSGRAFSVASRSSLPGISLFDGPGPAANKPDGGAPPATTGAPPAATTGAPPAATTGAPPAATTGAPPAATTPRS